MLAPAAGTVEPRGAVRLLPQTPVALPRASALSTGSARQRALLDEGEARTLLGAFALGRGGRARRSGASARASARASTMAAMVASGAELLLLDEPTNHLDPETLEAVEPRCAPSPATIVAVSHDRAFLDGIGVTRRFEVRDGAVRELA